MTHVSPAVPTRSELAERRSFPRFEVALAGLCSVNLGPDARCASIDLSIAGIALRTAVSAVIGDPVIASFREFGLVRGRVVRFFDGGFAFALNTVNPYRSRLSQYLVWRVGGLEERLGEVPVGERLVPVNRLAMLTLVDGHRIIGRVENVWRSGISFTATTAFALGEAVRVGKHPAKVVRVLEEGVTAAFESPLAERFDAMISFANAE